MHSDKKSYPQTSHQAGSGMAEHWATDARQSKNMPLA
jgi:hypothetical protein